MALRPLTVWITRARPAAEATAERVREMGHQPVVEPLLAVKPFEDVAIDLEGVAALAFTSANGVRAFAEACPERGLRVFAVGAATAQAARAAGFRGVLSSDGDVEVLAEGIAQRRREIAGVVLHPGAAEPAGDLTGALERQGVPARRLVLYDTVQLDLPAERAQAVVASDVALLHSPKGAKALAAILKRHPSPGLRVLGLSQKVLQPLAGVPLAGRAFPPFPLEAALLNLIDRTP